MGCIYCNYPNVVPKIRKMKVGQHVGYYCPRCGKWQGKWLNKEEKAKLNLSELEVIIKEEM